MGCRIGLRTGTQLDDGTTAEQIPRDDGQPRLGTFPVRVIDSPAATPHQKPQASRHVQKSRYPAAASGVQAVYRDGIDNFILGDSPEVFKAVPSREDID